MPVVLAKLFQAHTAVQTTDVFTTLNPSHRAFHKVGDVVEGRYTADDTWYSAVIRQVIHGGFEIARFEVLGVGRL